MTKEQALEVIEKVIGDISFWGETRQDEENAENIKVYAYVATEMMSRLGEVYDQTKGRYAASSKPLFKEAKAALANVMEYMPSLEKCACSLSPEEWKTYCYFANNSDLDSLSVSCNNEIIVTDDKGKEYTFSYYEKVDVSNPNKEENR